MIHWRIEHTAHVLILDTRHIFNQNDHLKGLCSKLTSLVLRVTGICNRLCGFCDLLKWV